jgi:hypothetical protein
MLQMRKIEFRGPITDNTIAVTMHAARIPETFIYPVWRMPCTLTASSIGTPVRPAR